MAPSFAATFATAVPALAPTVASATDVGPDFKSTPTPATLKLRLQETQRHSQNQNHIVETGLTSKPRSTSILASAKPVKPTPAAAAVAGAGAGGTEHSRRHGEPFVYPERRRARVASTPITQAVPSGVQELQNNRHYVFVYGTLKRGFANAHLLERATYVGDFRTAIAFPLVVGGRYHSPYLLDMPGVGNRVKGEVYAVDDATLADLDHLERVGTNYTRKIAKVSSAADRSVVAHTYIYFKSTGMDELVNNTFLDDYQCRRYVPRHLR